MGLSPLNRKYSRKYFHHLLLLYASNSEIGIKSTGCGPESFTPDHKPVMGEDPRVRGFFHGVGFNSAGMMLGGGCGDQLAKWVVKGRPDLDMYG